MTMLLTLASRSFKAQIKGKKARSRRGDGDELTMLDLPAYTRHELDLRGLNIFASMLAGWSLEELDLLRDRADKAGCPCLILVEDAPLAFSHSRASERQKAIERMNILGLAAHRLGCNAIGIAVEAEDTDEQFDTVAAQIKSTMPPIERLELNILLMPHDGLTHDPDRLTDLIKRIGGFRIGSLPSFSHAASTGDTIETLRKLAPYAGAIHGSITSFSKNGKHNKYDLRECIHAVRNVGFVNTIAIDYQGRAKNPVPAIEQARDQMQHAIEEE